MSGSKQKLFTVSSSLPSTAWTATLKYPRTSPRSFTIAILQALCISSYSRLSAPMDQGDRVHEVAEVDDGPSDPAEPRKAVVEGVAACSWGEASHIRRRWRHLCVVAVHLPHQLQTLPDIEQVRQGH